MQDTLERFLALRHVFEQTGVRPSGFSLPRQHSLLHYISGIQFFGSPNGLCSSITESQHIAAVKKPWRSLSRRNPLKEIIATNVRISKLSAARVDFGHRGMLTGDVLTAARIELGLAVDGDHMPPEQEYEARYGVAVDDVEADNGPQADITTKLAVKPGQ